MVPLIGPGVHDDAGDADAPVVEDLVVGGPEMGPDIVVHRLLAPGRGDDAPVHGPAHPVRDVGAGGLAHVTIIILHDVVEVMRVAVGRPHDREEGQAPRQLIADHVQVDVAKRPFHPRGLGLDVGDRPGELGRPEEADRPPGLGQTALCDEPLERPGGFEDRGRPRGIVVRPEHAVALEDVGRDDDLLGVRVRAGDGSGDVLELGLFGPGFDDGPDADLLAVLEPVAEEDAIARRQAEGEFRRPVPSVKAAPGDEKRVEKRPRRRERDDPGRALADAADIVHRTRVTRRDQDLVLDVESLEILGLPLSHPNELGRDVGRRASRSQHGREVDVGSDLLASGLDFPKLAFDPVPGLAAGETEDGRVGQPVILEPVEDVLGLGERPGVFGGLAVAREAAHGHDVVEGRLAGGLADDLVHLILGQEGPLQPGGHLRCGRDAEKKEDRGHEDGSFLGHGQAPFKIWITVLQFSIRKPGLQRSGVRTSDR